MERGDIEFVIAIATFAVAAYPFFIWLHSRHRKLRITTTPLSWATLDDPICIDEYEGCQRAAVMLDIAIRNTLDSGVMIESYEVEYRSRMLRFQDSWWWKRLAHLEEYIEQAEFLYQWVLLEGPIPMKTPATVIGENNRHRIMPHRLVNFIDLNVVAISSYLQGNEANSGVLLFESKGRFWGGGGPYVRKNNTMAVRCTVKDGRGVKSSTILEIRLVSIALARTSHKDVLVVKDEICVSE